MFFPGRVMNISNLFVVSKSETGNKLQFVPVNRPWSRPEGLGELSAPPCSCII